MDSHAYLADCRVKSMRMLSKITGVHAQGLAQAARVARRTEVISNQMSKKLIELDSAFHFSKHASELNSQRFIGRLSLDIETQSKPLQIAKKIQLPIVIVNQMMRIRNPRQAQRNRKSV